MIPGRWENKQFSKPPTRSLFHSNLWAFSFEMVEISLNLELLNPGVLNQSPSLFFLADFGGIHFFKATALAGSSMSMSGKPEIKSSNSLSSNKDSLGPARTDRNFLSKETHLGMSSNPGADVYIIPYYVCCGMGDKTNSAQGRTVPSLTIVMLWRGTVWVAATEWTALWREKEHCRGRTCSQNPCEQNLCGLYSFDIWPWLQTNGLRVDQPVFSGPKITKNRPFGINESHHPFIFNTP